MKYGEIERRHKKKIKINELDDGKRVVDKQLKLLKVLH